MDSRCLHVAVNLDLADAVTDDPRDLVEVAREVGADAGALTRIVRHLAASGRLRVPSRSHLAQRSLPAVRTDDPERHGPADQDAGAAGDLGLLRQPGGSRAHGPSRDDVRGSRRVLRLSGRPPRRVRRLRPGHDRDDRPADRPDGSPLRLHALRGHRRHRRRTRTSASSRSRADTRRARGVLFDRAQVVEDLPPDAAHRVCNPAASSPTPCPRPTATCCPTSSTTGPIKTQCRS